jgi:hypothetical protein
VGIRGGGAGRGGGVRRVGRPRMVPERGGGGRELLGAGSLGGGGLGNSSLARLQELRRPWQGNI